MGVDPLAADYAAWSPYNYVMGNPIRLIDPDGRSVDDIIGIDRNGVVVTVIPMKGEHIFFDVDTKEALKPHDPNAADFAMRARTTKYEVGDHLYIPISDEAKEEFIQRAGFEPKRKLNNIIPLDGHLEAKELSIAGKADFPMELSKKYSDLLSVISTSDSEGNTFTEVVGAMIRFGSSSTLYNGSDAGQYLWGAWMNRNGFSLSRSLWGANRNERKTGGDSKADQQAITNGFNSEEKN